MAKTRRNLKKTKTRRRKSVGGNRTKRKCPCSGGKFPSFFKGGKSKRRRLKRRTRKTKKQRGGFFKELGKMVDYTVYLGEKQTASLGGMPPPKSPDPTKGQNPNSSA
mgnify:CR=1 FL=1|jgi:hypothetical protein|tara:strand:- start:1883 stop:2203 length:321 start_codon:yes stop_codon:yes gene_type:complete